MSTNKLSRGAARFIGIICALIFGLSLLAAGYAICCFRPTTAIISQNTSNFEQAPYTSADLVSLAVSSRDFTVDNHLLEGMDGAATELAQAVIEAARSSSAALGTEGLWRDAAITLINSPVAEENPLETMYALAQINESYGFSPEAISHLTDCNNLIVPINTLLIVLFLIGIALLIWLLVRDQKRIAGLSLMVAPLVMVAFFALAAIWAILDWRGLFSFFHAIFFPQGNWTFPADSLLILMYPAEFWQTMASVWAVVTLVLSILVFFIGFRLFKVNDRKARQ